MKKDSPLVMPFGWNAGTPIEEVDPAYIFWLCYSTKLLDKKKKLREIKTRMINYLREIKYLK